MTAATSTDARRGAIALGMVVVWALGAWQSHAVGIWLAIGSTAAFLGVAALCLDGRALVASLRCRPRSLAIGAAVGFAMIVATHLVFAPLAAVFPELASVSDSGKVWTVQAFASCAPQTI